MNVKLTSKLKTGITILALVIYPLVNRSQNSIANKMLFAAEPFSKNPKEQKEFKWDGSIYAKITLQKALKNFAQKIDAYELDRYKISGVYSNYLKFICIPIGEDENQRSNSEITLYLTDAELEKNEVNIDVLPAKKHASSFFGSGFYSELMKNDLVKYNVETETSVGKKTEFTIYLFERAKNLNDENGKKDGKLITNYGVFVSLANLIVDYTPVTDSRIFMDWKNEYNAVTDSINSKYKDK